jgi:hypothetical protein
MIRSDLLWRSAFPLVLLALLLLMVTRARGQEPPPRSESATASDLLELESRVRSVADGRLVFSYPTRPGVYGDGDQILSWSHEREDRDWWDSDCTEGPARVELRIRDGEVHRLRTRVGGVIVARAYVDDLGMLSPKVAAEFLMHLAETAREAVAEDAIFAALIAEGYEDWGRLLQLARNGHRPDDVREAAVFWLGQAAGEVATDGLQSILEDESEDLQLREHAIFALSQRPANEAVPALSHVALESPHPQLRKSALFWLAQHDEDPRVLRLFEEILTP